MSGATIWFFAWFTLGIAFGVHMLAYHTGF